MRIDARAADQTAAAGAAQARAARAALDVATRDFERQQQLFAQGFISQAALDRADAHFKTAQAEASAQLANAGAARTQSDFYVVKAPYGGVVASVSVVLGDMAMPGRPLLTLYDPAALRVTAAIPQTAVAELGRATRAPGRDSGRGGRSGQAGPCPAAAHGRRGQPHAGIAPGSAPRHGCRARHVRPRVAVRPRYGRGTGDARLFVPSQALVRRSELAAVYVIGRDGKPLLRQVRPGRSDGDQVEILSGVAAGERVALDPQAAARIR